MTFFGKFFLFTNYHISVLNIFYTLQFLFTSRSSDAYHRLEKRIKNFFGFYISLCYSCRTAFYIILKYLSTRNVNRKERGGEIIMTGLTIRNFVNLDEYFDYKIVPLDIDLDNTNAFV